MPRRVQDIIPSNRRSIRDIPVVRDTKSDKKVAQVKQVAEKRNKKKTRLPWLFSILGVIVIIAGIAFGISGHFATATFNLVPKIIPVNVNGTYIIPNASGASSTPLGSFGYETISLSGTASTTVPATQGSFTQTKAQGSITLYNSYSSQSQKIVAGTRITNNSGLIYRLTSSVIVPGFTSSGVTAIPGSINASIIADQAGSQYNISGSDSISDFKVVAYKGTPKYSGFYGRLSGDVSGGFSGTQILVPPTLLASTTVTLQNNLNTELLHNITSSIPLGYVMYPSSYFSSFGKPVVTTIDPKTAKISLTETLYGIILNKNNLAKLLAGASSTNAFGLLGYIEPNIESLSVIFSNQKDFSISKKTNFIARINGSFNLVGSIPANALKQAFAGVSISKTGDILKKYTSVIDVQHSSAEINPPWVSTVSNDQSRIIINVKTP